MPVTARLLYYDLAMRADDDGFVNSPKKIMRMIGASQDDLSILCLRKFIIPFDSGVVVIKHWRIHNYIQNDRYKPTSYQDEKSKLIVKDNKAYALKEGYEAAVVTPRIQNVSNMEAQVRLDKDSLDKDRENSAKGTSRKFVPPTFEEVKAYCDERNNGIDPQHFIDYYQTRGWVLSNGKKMVDFRAAIRTWEQRNKKEVPVETKDTLKDAIKRNRR